MNVKHVTALFIKTDDGSMVMQHDKKVVKRSLNELGINSALLNKTEISIRENK